MATAPVGSPPATQPPPPLPLPAAAIDVNSTSVFILPKQQPSPCPELCPRYGRWLVTDRRERQNKKWRAWCVCDCGQVERWVDTYHLRRGVSQSCGCLKREKASARSRLAKSQGSLGSHHGSYSREYGIYRCMLNRCYNPRCTSYANYGGRGIRVDDRWRGRSGYVTFLADMGEAPSREHTLERVDVDKSYSSENCRWATRLEQARNRRDTVWVTFEGRTCCLSAWAEITGIPIGCLRTRHRLRWPPEQMLTLPPTKQNRYLRPKAQVACHVDHQTSGETLSHRVGD